MEQLIFKVLLDPFKVIYLRTESYVNENIYNI